MGSFVVCNVCNLGDRGQFREQQLVFRYDGERRHIPVNKEDGIMKLSKDDFAETPLPSYWTVPKILNFKAPRAIVACDPDEIEDLRRMVDYTFKRVLTRDRQYEPHIAGDEEMPFHLQVVNAFRSENSALYHKFAQRRKLYAEAHI